MCNSYTDEISSAAENVFVHLSQMISGDESSHCYGSLETYYSHNMEKVLICLRFLSGFYLLWGAGGSFPPKRLSFPPKSFPEKRFKAISNKDLFDDDFKELVKVTNVQKCNFSQF